MISIASLIAYTCQFECPLSLALNLLRLWYWKPSKVTNFLTPLDSRTSVFRLTPCRAVCAEFNFGGLLISLLLFSLNSQVVSLKAKYLRIQEGLQLTCNLLQVLSCPQLLMTCNVFWVGVWALSYLHRGFCMSWSNNNVTMLCIEIMCKLTVELERWS